MDTDGMHVASRRMMQSEGLVREETMLCSNWSLEPPMRFTRDISTEKEDLFGVMCDFEAVLMVLTVKGAKDETEGRSEELLSLHWRNSASMLIGVEVDEDPRDVPADVGAALKAGMHLEAMALRRVDLPVFAPPMTPMTVTSPKLGPDEEAGNMSVAASRKLLISSPRRDWYWFDSPTSRNRFDEGAAGDFRGSSDETDSCAFMSEGLDRFGENGALEGDAESATPCGCPPVLLSLLCGCLVRDTGDSG
jgi:hypothetical protein